MVGYLKIVSMSS